MSGSLNRVTLIGHLGQDPESRSFQSGGKVVRFSIATNESWTDKQTGERRERVEWHRVSVLNPGLATLAEEYLRKGAKVMVEGQLRTSKFTDREGIERYATEVVLTGFDARMLFLDGRRDDEGTGSGTARQRQPASAAQPRETAMAGAGADLDDEIPF